MPVSNRLNDAAWSVWSWWPYALLAPILAVTWVLVGEVWADNDGGLAPVLTLQDSLDAPVAEGTVLRSQAATRRW